MTAAARTLSSTPQLNTLADGGDAVPELPRELRRALDDANRIGGDDADYTRLHTRVVERLTASVRDLADALRAHPADEQDLLHAFVERHTALLRGAYAAGHAEGTRDYWGDVSRRYTGDRAPGAGDVDPEQAEAALTFYAPSVARLAAEAKQVATRIALADAVRLDELDDWVEQIAPRIVLQAQVVWSGLQDGYVDARADDPAAPWAHLWWELGPVRTRHCFDCPAVAAGSPYDAPGYGEHVLTQTPGDGRTQCGAGCKCSLRYGPAAAPGQQQQPGQQGQAVFPAPVRGAAGRYSWDEVRLLGAQSPRLSDAQRGALDRFRSAWNRWRRIHGSFPAMPDLFALRSGALADGFVEEWTSYLDHMTDAQRATFLEAAAAAEDWNAATAAENAALGYFDDGAPGDVADDTQLRDTGEDAIRLRGFGRMYVSPHLGGGHGGMGGGGGFDPMLHPRGTHGQFRFNGGRHAQEGHESQRGIGEHLMASRGSRAGAGGAGAGTGGGNERQRAQAETLLAARHAEREQVVHQIGRYGEWLSAHGPEHPKYGEVAEYHGRLVDRYHTLNAEIAAREQALGRPSMPHALPKAEHPAEYPAPKPAAESATSPAMPPATTPLTRAQRQSAYQADYYRRVERPRREAERAAREAAREAERARADRDPLAQAIRARREAEGDLAAFENKVARLHRRSARSREARAARPPSVLRSPAQIESSRRGGAANMRRQAEADAAHHAMLKARVEEARRVERAERYKARKRANQARWIERHPEQYAAHQKRQSAVLSAKRKSDPAAAEAHRAQARASAARRKERERAEREAANKQQRLVETAIEKAIRLWGRAG